MVTRCIAIGASAGGFQVLKDLVSQLPGDLPVPVFVVLHIAAYEPSLLPEILNSVGRLPALHPEDGAEVKPGMIYVAPPDHHLLTDDGHVAVKRGPKENGFRPSIDALFRSAAYSFGPGTIGVVLSGALNDGTSGLWSIKRLGGVAIVQDPREAEFPSMPRSALEYIDADYKVSSKEIAPLLSHLAKEQPVQEMQIGNGIDDDLTRMAKEVQIAAGVSLPEKTVLELGELTPFTCPECRGTLVRIQEGGLFRFRCHTGHAFTADALLEGIMESVGNLIWQAQRGFQEATMLLEHIGGHMQERGELTRGEVFLAKARELTQKATMLQKLAINHQVLSEENIENEESSD